MCEQSANHKTIFVLWFDDPQLEACEIYSQYCQNRESNEAGAFVLRHGGDDTNAARCVHLTQRQT